ncbi:invasion protein CiaB [Campylobacter troglodytis]|uniref:invasion protein CiaB n=1 Tax=Campylobacter troglodytis TaxID=654363 RepID=UPI001158D9F3|nr:invasion protein CiaB [Campylobacter troglodytis]TQR57323.1 hypothetical protein DMC01_08615 [Campylobacter troglodytis]
MSNNFKELAKLVKKRKAKLNDFFEVCLKTQKLQDELLTVLNLSGLKEDKTSILAVIYRFAYLKEENLIEEFKKASFDQEKIKQLKNEIYDELSKFYAKEHTNLIKEIEEAKLLDPFFMALIKGVHKIGLVMNDFAKAWSKKILQTNNELLATEFQSLEDALNFLNKNGLYQRDQEGAPCERSYGCLVRINDKWSFLPYALCFKKESSRLEKAFNELITKLKSKAKEEEHLAYLRYFDKLKLAFCEEDNDKVITRWQEAELAWLDLRSPLQVGHPLEYYEDKYTHAVALEWDLRLNDESEFKEDKFTKEIKESFELLCQKIELKDKALQSEVLHNLNKTQLYICMPMLYYGTELNGLFSAQVVPNDEFVSARGGKKIFAFLNFVYENAKTRPFMRLASEVFDEEFLDYGRDLLFCQEKIWKKVYEVSTIGHEFGHIFFIAQNSERLMNQSGVFKNIEEFKATAGGLVNFFLHEDEGLILPVFYDLIKRAISLIAWQRVEEVKPYYTEGLIHLHLLFQSEVLDFDGENLSIDFSKQGYERWKKLFFESYLKLARIYLQRRDAKEFLELFCLFKDEIFLPKEEKCLSFVKFYYQLYEKFGNEIDESGKFEYYRAKFC